MRVLAAVVGKQQVAEWNDRWDEGRARAERKAKSGCEQGEDKRDLRPDLTAEKHADDPEGIEDEGARDLEFVAAETGVAAEILVRRPAREGRDDDLERHDEPGGTCDRDECAEPQPSLRQERETEPDGDERQLLFHEKRNAEADQERYRPPCREEIHSEPERQHCERDLVEVVERDPRERRGKDVDGDPDEPLLAPRKVAAREEVVGQRAERQGDSLKDDERFGMREERIERDDEEKSRREVIEEEGVRIAPLEAEGRLHETAVDGIPQHLVEHPEIECRRVKCPMPDKRERT